MKTVLLKQSIALSLLLPIPALAASPQCNGLKAVGGGGSCSAGALTTKIGSIIDTLFIVIGSVAVIIIITGGIRYITSTGDSTRIQRAKDTILYAVIGLIIAVLARAIVGFVIGHIA